MAYTQDQINAAYAAERARGASDADLQRIGAERYGVTADQFAAAQRSAGTGLSASAAPAAPAPSPAPSAPPAQAPYQPPATQGYSSSYGWNDERLAQLKANAYGGGADDAAAVRNFADTALKSGWGAAETASVWNRVTGQNATADQVSSWMSGQNMGTLGANMGLQEQLQSALAAAYHGRNADEQNAYLDAATSLARQKGVGAGQLGGAVARLTGMGYDQAVAGVDTYTQSRNTPVLRADADWAAEKGVNQLRLDNRDMHLNGMYAEDAAQQTGR